MSVPDPVTIAVTGGLVVSSANQVAKQAQDFVAAATGHPGESIGTILGNMMQRRINNVEGILSSAHLTLLSIGVTAKDIPPKTFQPMIEGASLEEEPTLRAAWVAMLANAADPRDLAPVSAIFPAILRELSVRDVVFLDALYGVVSREAGERGKSPKDYYANFNTEDLRRIYRDAKLAETPEYFSGRKRDARADQDNRNFEYSLATLKRHALLDEEAFPRMVDNFDAIHNPNPKPDSVSSRRARLPSLIRHRGNRYKMNDDEKELLKVGAETAMKPFANLIEKLFGGAVEEIGLGWTNRLAVRRRIQEIKLFQKLNAAIEAASFDPSAIPDKIWMPAIQGALSEDDDDMQTTWANLLANASDPRTPGFVEPSFSTILKDLTSRDVRFLDGFFARVISQGGGYTYPTSGVEFLEHVLKEVFDRAGLSKVPISAQPNSPGAIPAEYMVEDDQNGYYLCIDALRRAQLIEKHVRTHFHDALNAGSGQAYETFSLTALGMTFIRACQPPPKL